MGKRDIFNFQWLNFLQNGNPPRSSLASLVFSCFRCFWLCRYCKPWAMSYNIARWQDLWVRMCSLARRTGGWTWIVSLKKTIGWWSFQKWTNCRSALWKWRTPRASSTPSRKHFSILLGVVTVNPMVNYHPIPSRPLRQVIFSRGEPCTWLGLLLAGRCQAFLPNGKNELRMGEHLPGEPLTRGGVNTKRDINIESA